MRQRKEDNIKIGEGIRNARERSHITQEKLAEKVGVSSQYISDLERGMVGISIPTLKRVCVSLSISSDEILFGPKDESRQVILAEKCRALSDPQFQLLTEIIDKYVEAVTAQNEKSDHPVPRN